MNEIEKIIEEEAKKHADYYPTDLAYFGIQLKPVAEKEFKAGANFALSQLEHANRWRKVSEELPEVKSNHYFINVKKGDISIATIAILSGTEDVREYLEFYGISEWKPID